MTSLRRLLEKKGNLVLDGAMGTLLMAAGLKPGGSQEVRAAVEGARAACSLPVVATMSFDAGGRTMMGVSPEQAVEELSRHGLVALGGNCGSGTPEIMRDHALRARELGARLLGGCCGTTPAHIRAMAEGLGTLPAPAPGP